VNVQLTDSLRLTLGLVRGREEHYRDVALAIQRLLEAEGAMYPEAAAIQPVVRTAVAVVKPSATAGAAAGAGPEKAKAKNGPRTWPKTCVMCGTKFDARSASAKCCSEKCVKEKNRRYANAKYQTNKHIAEACSKPAPKAAAPKAAQVPTGYQKVCVVCGKPYTPTRKDQKCCSTVCGKRRHLEAKPNASKPPAVANKAPAEGAAPVTRVDRIRAAVARLDGMPQSAIDAAREAAESDGAR
jgi:predicted nucleic acid-binding Zn ribbon protein